MVHMQPQEFEDTAVALAREIGWCYISARFIERIDAGQVNFEPMEALTCGLFSSITHELLASVCE